MDRLRETLRRIDGRGYKAYKDLGGSYRFPFFTLTFDHVQGDPFAAPSRISVVIPPEKSAFPETLRSTPVRRIALEDFIARSVGAAIRRCTRGRRGIGKSGLFAIAATGQQVLRRNAVLLSDQGVEARLTVGLPASGRTILGREAEQMLLEELPAVVEKALLYQSLDPDGVKRQVESVEDQAFLRAWLEKEGLIAFVADGSVLPRRSGVDDRPLEEGAVPFCSPGELARSVTLPNAGEVRGMGIPRGVTLVVGGGFHGKSTLLHALERGVYDHIPGDGRERVATDPTAVKVRAEDGRIIHGVNISPFISNLPLGRDTRHFSTENASGSTSQAANIVEALEAGARTLLIDEDTSATNFMIRDRRMQQLVSRENEPITPLLHRVRELYQEHGVSTVVVMGGSGDYFDVADRVIMLDSYRALDVTAEARSIAGSGVSASPSGSPAPLGEFPPRRLDPALLDPSRGRREVKIDCRGIDAILYGEQFVDLSRVEQLVDAGQLRAISLLLLRYARRYAESDTPLVEGLRRTLDEAENAGLDILSEYKSGDLCLPRLFELAAAASRIRPNTT